MFAPVYFDHNATTPLDPVAREAMQPWLGERFGNASSRHEYGRSARAAVDEARQRVAAAVGAHPTEVIFVSCGSEANNLFVKGVAAARRRPGSVTISAIEHPSIARPAKQLEAQGWRLSVLPVSQRGCVIDESYAQALSARPQIVSVMHANNESGVVQDVAMLAEAAKAAGACFHTDAVQAFGRVALDFRALNATGVRAMTISSHKVYGPKGAAALIVDKRVELEPLIAGGGHERGLRSGTENVAAIVGFGIACERAIDKLEERARRLELLRRRLETGLDRLGAHVFGRGAPRIPNTSYFALDDVDGETLVGRLDRLGFAVASGAACSSANPEPSHVLIAMGIAPELARGAIRVSLGEGNDEVQVDQFVAALQEASGVLKQMTAVVNS